MARLAIIIVFAPLIFDHSNKNIQYTTNLDLRWILLLFLIYFHPFFYYQCNPIQTHVHFIFAYTRIGNQSSFPTMCEEEPTLCNFSGPKLNFRINERLYYFMQNIVCGMYRLLLLQCSQWGYFLKKWIDMYEPMSMVIISLFFLNFVPHSLTKCEWLSELQSHSCWVLTCLDTPSSTIKYYFVQKAWHNGWMLSTNFTYE